jgi:hypothetical protein
MLRGLTMPKRSMCKKGFGAPTFRSGRDWDARLRWDISKLENIRHAG